jgi:hypothetical protein
MVMYFHTRAMTYCQIAGCKYISILIISFFLRVLLVEALKESLKGRDGRDVRVRGSLGHQQPVTVELLEY